MTSPSTFNLQALIDNPYLKSLAAQKQPAPAPLSSKVTAQGNDFTNQTFMPNTGPGSLGYNNGGQLMGPLSVPQNIVGADTFTWALGSNNGTDESGTAYGSHQIIQMTLAGAMSWLRDLSVHNKPYYNEIVGELVQSGYLQPADARLNGYTTVVAQKFLQSAVDVIGVNNDLGQNAQTGGGAVTTWQNHIDQLIQGRKDMGQLDANGAPISGSGSGSGGGAQAPVEQDVFTDPATVKHYINAAARNVLGRQLTDDEAAKFQAAFHGTEATWNKQKFASDTAQFNGQASGATTAPNASVAAEDYVNTDPTLATERTQQMVGSYVNVLRNMLGGGSGGVSSAVS